MDSEKESTQSVEQHVSLAAKLARVMKKVGPVAQDGSNDRQNYSFQSEAAVKSAVKDVLANEGIIIIPNITITKEWQATTRNNNVMNFVNVQATYTITDGVENITASMPATGQDSGEKATVKAATTAQKYLYKQLFNITDREEDPDTTDSRPDGGFKNSQPQQNYQSSNQNQRGQPSKQPAKQSASLWAIDAIIKKLIKLIGSKNAQERFANELGAEGLTNWDELTKTNPVTQKRVEHEMRTILMEVQQEHAQNNGNKQSN